jgi:hypothetical protein
MKVHEHHDLLVAARANARTTPANSRSRSLTPAMLRGSQGPYQRSKAASSEAAGLTAQT